MPGYAALLHRPPHDVEPFKDGRLTDLYVRTLGLDLELPNGRWRYAWLQSTMFFFVGVRFDDHQPLLETETYDLAARRLLRDTAPEIILLALPDIILLHDCLLPPAAVGFVRDAWPMGFGGAFP